MFRTRNWIGRLTLEARELKAEKKLQLQTLPEPTVTENNETQELKQPAFEPLV